MTSQAQRYLEKLDIGYSYRLAKRMEEHCTNPVLGYRTAGSPAEIATGDMLAAEMKKIGFSKVWKDAITVDAWEFEKAELSFTDAEGRERHVQLGAYQTNFVTDGPTAYELVYAGKGTEADYEGLDVNGKLPNWRGKTRNLFTRSSRKAPARASTRTPCNGWSMPGWYTKFIAAVRPVCRLPPMMICRRSKFIWSMWGCCVGLHSWHPRPLARATACLPSSRAR